MTDIKKMVLQEFQAGRLAEEAAFKILNELKYMPVDFVAEDIAIVGIACRFPDAANPYQFWSNLLDRKIGIRPYPASRHYDLNDRTIIPLFKETFAKAGYLTELDKFDPNFFRISKAEALSMDPHQRVLLETHWHAFEDAGYGDPHQIYGTKTGVFVGRDHTSYGSEYRVVVDEKDPQASTGLSSGILASRISYIYDFRGPSLVVDTACSSGLVAVHIASKALLRNECDIAVASGIQLYPFSAVTPQMNLVLSPEGEVRPFDKSAKGTVWGEGACAVVLKKVSKALQDRDHIYALIKGSAVNNDGASNGITAPRAEAQEDVILQAWKDAKIDPQTISYVETHGTGTVLGDPIETKGLTRAFERFTQRKQFCGIGSVKSNIGHLVGASGIVSLIKVALSLKNRQLAPSLNFEMPNPLVSFQDSPLFLNDVERVWNPECGVRRAGVNSFGFSGTNCHVVLEESPDPRHVRLERESETQNLYWLLPLSTKYQSGLRRLVQDYISFVKGRPDFSVCDLCFTAATGRGHYPYRLAVQFKDKEDLLEKLEGLLTSSQSKYIAPAKTESADRPFYFPASEDDVSSVQYNFMDGAAIDWDRFFDPTSAKRISLPVYPFEKIRIWSEEKAKNKGRTGKLLGSRINEKLYQNILLAKRDWILDEHRIDEQVVVPGTAYIEMVAELANDLFPGESFELTQFNMMLPLVVLEDEIEVLLETHIQVHDERVDFSISGKHSSTKKSESLPFNERVHAKGTLCKMSHLISPVLDVVSVQNKCLLNEDSLPMVSQFGRFRFGPRWMNVKKVNYGENEWLAELQLPEQFSSDLKQFLLHPALMDLALNVMSQRIRGGTAFLPSSIEKIQVFGALGSRLLSYIRLKENTSRLLEFDATISLPTGEVVAEVMGYRLKKWNSSALPLPQLWVKAAVPKEYSPTRRIYNSDGATAIVSLPGACVEAISLVQEVPNAFTISAEHVKRLQSVNSLKQVIFLLGEGDPEQVLLEFYNVMRSVVKAAPQSKVDWLTLSIRSQSVENPDLSPTESMIFSAAQVVQLECTAIQPRMVVSDVTAVLNQTDQRGVLHKEILHPSQDVQVIYVRGRRFTQELRAKSEDSAISSLDNKREYETSDGVVLITGGLGGIGLEIARYLAHIKYKKIALLGRTSPGTKKQLDVINEIRNLGAQVELIQCDVLDREGITRVMRDLEEKYSYVSGIIHCAGIAGSGYLMDKSDQKICEVIRPKIQGAENILQALSSADPDALKKLKFIILFSSITSLFSMAGQSDYSAANAYLDSLAKKLQKQGLPAMSISWPVWKDAGMAVQRGMVEKSENFVPFHAISTSQACRVLDVAMTSRDSHLGVGDLNIEVAQRLLAQFSIPLVAELTRRRIEKADGLPSQHLNASDRFSSLEEVESRVALIWRQVLVLDQIDVNESFYNLGGDSILASKLVKAIDQVFSGMFQVGDVFTFSTVRLMAARIYELLDPQQKIVPPLACTSDLTQSRDIAVIGVSGRLPPISDIDEFWNSLIEGKSCIRPMPAHRANNLGGSADAPVAAYLDDIASFDPNVFRISPREAVLMDPHQRLILETSAEAMEDAGYGGRTLAGSPTGVFIGRDHLTELPYKRLLQTRDALSATGSWPAIVASRVSYTFNLKGPSLVIDTACSSSLVAIHTACQALLSGECEVALAGGAHLIIVGDGNTTENKAFQMVQSNSDQVFAFEKRSCGTRWGEAVGMFLLKPLARAVADGDSIYVVIKSSAVNNDGASNGITAPDARAQADLLATAWKKAGINPETISYIEAHGTGTQLGDSIEVQGLTEAFRKFSQRQQFCSLGSVKTNIGHCVAASGIASFLKVLMSFKYKTLAPNANFERPNPHIDFKNSPVFIQDRASSWDGSFPLRAGISSFGFSGTNCHLVLEEAPISQTIQMQLPSKSEHLLALSAKSDKALRDLLVKYLEFIKMNPKVGLGDLCFTANTGRSHYTHRLAIIVSNLVELSSCLSQVVMNETISPSETPTQIYQGSKESGGTVDSLKGMTLSKIADLYIQGYQLPWLTLYENQKYRRLHLPTYAYERRNFWPSVKNFTGTTEIVLTGRKLPGDSYTDHERKMGQIWGKILGLQEISIFATFHELGGDSILAGQLDSELRDHFLGVLQVADLYSYPTIHQLCRYFESIQERQDDRLEKIIESSNQSQKAEISKWEAILDQAVPEKREGEHV